MTTTITYTTTGHDPAVDEAFESALRATRDGGVIRLAHLIGGHELASGPLREHCDPCEPQRTLTSTHTADVRAVVSAVEAARRAQVEWGASTVSERCGVLRRIADHVSERRYELAAVVSAETGKTRTESLAEIQECADLVTTYCEEIERHDGYRLSLRELTDHESNTSLFRPYGVFAVIAPFNFPAALALNMVLGALVAGNATVLKPAEQAPWSGALIGEIAQAAGLLPGLLNVIHGDEDVGRALVDAEIDGVAFTGSAEAGHAIARRLHRQRPLRPLILEMGGKNPAVVAASADLDRAAEGIARAAFGLSGQKCSACSRVVVVDDVHDELVERLVEHASRWAPGDPIDRASALGPVIDPEAVARFEASCRQAAGDGLVLAGGERPQLPGYYVCPTVVAGLPRGHSLTREELFLPFLTVTPANSFSEAIEEANAVDYGLTAGVFTRDQAEQREFLDRALAGVLYVNRREGATTGAWPGVQSFCGWKASGASGIGGLGPHYLLQFMREQTHTIMS
jgi:1-pyrroline-5-carboxylate dehydrogenase